MWVSIDKLVNQLFAHDEIVKQTDYYVRQIGV